MWWARKGRRMSRKDDVRTYEARWRELVEQVYRFFKEASEAPPIRTLTDHLATIRVA